MAESTPSQHVIETMIKYFDEVESIIEDLKSRIPEGMGNCRIIFKECPMGHGRLVAENWIDHGCLVCQINQYRSEINHLQMEISSLIRKYQS